MIFNSIWLTGFGIFSNAAMPDLCPGLNVIVGPNEAGKSTTLEFIRALLFGFRTGKGARKFESVNGGAHGGWALVTTAGGSQVRIQRGPGGAAGIGRADTVGPGPSVSFQDLLQGADRHLFESVFAFGLNELQQFDDGKSASIAAQIYGAGSNGFGASLVAAQAELETRSDALYKVKGRGQKERLRVLVEQRLALHGRVVQIQDGLEVYNQSRGELAALDSRLERLRTQREQAQKDLLHSKTCQKAWPTRVKLVQARRDLEDFGHVASFPSDGMASLDRLIDRREKLAEDEQRTHREIQRAQESLQGCVVDEKLLQAHPMLRRICQCAAQYESACRDLPLVKAEADHLGTMVNSIVEMLGHGWTRESLDGFDISIPAEDQVRERQKSLDAKERAFAAAGQSVSDRDEDVKSREALRQKAERDMTIAFPQEPPEVSDLREREQGLDHARSILEQMELLRAGIAACETRGGDLCDQQKLVESEVGGSRVSRFWPIPGLLVVGVFAAWLLRALTTVPVTGLVAIDLAIVLAGAILFWRGARRENARMEDQARASAAKLEAIERKGQEVGSQRADAIKKLNEQDGQLREIAGRLDCSLDTTELVRSEWTALQDARGRRARFDQMKLVSDARREEWDGSCKALQAVCDRASRAEKDLSCERKKWDEWLAVRNLPAGSSPETVLRLLQEVRNAREKLSVQEGELARVRQMEDAIQDFRKQVQALFVEIGRQSPAEDAAAVKVRDLADEAMENDKRATRKEGLESVLQQQNALWTATTEERSRVEDELSGLLQAGGAVSEQEFRDRAREFDARQSLEREIRARERELEALSGPGEARARLEGELEGSDKESLDLSASDCEMRAGTGQDYRG